jgi:uncharacterized protein YndB with AHSA1/START domain
MVAKIFITLAVVIVGFLVFVSTRDGHFRYARSGVINAPAEKIYPVISNFKLGQLWNPYDQKDPDLKRTFSGQDGQVGSHMDFAGNMQGGTGSLEIVKLVPNQSVQIRLIMTKPMSADNLVEYTLNPEGTATRFTWAMSGDGGFMGKLVGVFIDCEKMVAGDFEKGIANLKQLIESQK